MANAYVYVPGLAVDAEVSVKHDDDQLPIRAQAVFTVRNTYASAAAPDPFIAGTIKVLLEKGAKPVICRQALKWVMVPGPDEDAQVFKKVGMPVHNVLAKKLGDKPAPPIKLNLTKGTEPHAVHPRCTLPEHIAQAGTTKAAADVQNKPLARLQAGDTLYIVGHSNPNGGTLNYKRYASTPQSHPMAQYGEPPGCPAPDHFEKWHVDPVTLAALLVDEGLAATKIEIVVVGCFSGGLPQDELQTLQSYAQRLAGSLFARGYVKIRASGAKGLVIPGKGVMKVSTSALKQDDGSFNVDTQSVEPFHKRFFRFFKYSKEHT